MAIIIHLIIPQNGLFFTPDNSALYFDGFFYYIC